MLLLRLFLGSLDSVCLCVSFSVCLCVSSCDYYHFELTTRRVLTTEWVVGERLDKSEKGDVSILCSIAMNTYLTMMLETGVLHCDPVS